MVECLIDKEICTHVILSPFAGESILFRLLVKSHLYTNYFKLSVLNMVEIFDHDLHFLRMLELLSGNAEKYLVILFISWSTFNFINLKLCIP